MGGAAAGTAGRHAAAPAGGPAEGGGPAALVEYYTDPLCCWSWALEPQWRRIRYEFGDRLRWRYRMGGMLRDWSSFQDPLNDVASPAHMARHWYHVRTTAGVPLDERLWSEDPPSSSYPASLAVKAASLQGGEAGEAYLRRVREAALLERRNVARPAVLLALADEVGRSGAGNDFDPERFRHDLAGEPARRAFRDDLRETRYLEIGRFPTLVLRAHAGGPGLVLVGWHPYQAIRAALAEVVPVAPVRTAGGFEDYLERWGAATAGEVAEALRVPPEDARARLEDARDRGLVACAGPGGILWRRRGGHPR